MSTNPQFLSSELNLTITAFLHPRRAHSKHSLEKVTVNNLLIESFFTLCILTICLHIFLDLSCPASYFVFQPISILLNQSLVSYKLISPILYQHSFNIAFCRLYSTFFNNKTQNNHYSYTHKTHNFYISILLYYLRSRATVNAYVCVKETRFLRAT